MKKKRPIQALNEKARAIQSLAEGEEKSVEALQDGPPAMPVGCTTIFDTGWETNPRPTYPVGNCMASAKDFHGCAGDCWWPAQVPGRIGRSHRSLSRRLATAFRAKHISRTNSMNAAIGYPHSSYFLLKRVGG